MEFFAAPDRPLSTANKTPKSEPTNPNMIDPYAAIPLNNYEASDLFSDFTSHTSPVSAESAQNSPRNGLSSNQNTSHTSPVSAESSQNSPRNGLSTNQNTYKKSMSPHKKDAFQIKSGIWADSLSRGLIDLNISSRKLIFLEVLDMLILFCIHLNLFSFH